MIYRKNSKTINPFRFGKSSDTPLSIFELFSLEMPIRTSKWRQNAGKTLKVFVTWGSVLALSFFTACQNDPQSNRQTTAQNGVGETNQSDTPIPPPVVKPIADKPVWNFTVVPKQQAGDIIPTTTEEDLKKLYGEANVQRVNRGVVQTLVFPNTENEMEIAWRKGQVYKKIESVIIRKGKWQTPEGIRIGSSQKDLDIANGKPIQLAPISDEEMRPLWQGGKVHPQLVLGYDPNAGRVFMMQINF
jgi:hypothetical protein